MIVKLLTEHHLEFLSLKGGCRGSSESTLVKMPHCWKSHATAHNSYCMRDFFHKKMVKFTTKDCFRCVFMFQILLDENKKIRTSIPPIFLTPLGPSLRKVVQFVCI